MELIHLSEYLRVFRLKIMPVFQVGQVKISRELLLVSIDNFAVKQVKTGEVQVIFFKHLAKLRDRQLVFLFVKK